MRWMQKMSLSDAIYILSYRSKTDNGQNNTAKDVAVDSMKFLRTLPDELDKFNSLEEAKEFIKKRISEVENDRN